MIYLAIASVAVVIVVIAVIFILGSRAAAELHPPRSDDDE